MQQTSVNDHWHCILSNTQRSGHIDLDTGEYAPVGYIWKFDLELYEQRNFGVKWNFSKIRIEPVMLNFLATTENLRNTRREQSYYNRGKVVKKAAGNSYSQFPDIKITLE